MAIVDFSGAVKFGEPPVQESLWEAVVKPGATALERKELQDRRLEQAGAIYEELRASLETGLHWAVVSRDTVSRVVDARERPAPADESLAVAGIPEAGSLKRLAAADRAILAQRLEVDGLVSAEVEFRRVDGGGYKIVGLGNLTHHLIALTTISVFDANGELVWQEREVRGTRTAGSRSATSPDLAGESALMSEAARSSFDALVTRLSPTP